MALMAQLGEQRGFATRALGRIRTAPGAILRKWRARGLPALVRATFDNLPPSIISSNCVGGRLYELAGLPYRSPTVGLWIAPADFVRFAAALPHYMAQDIVHDHDLSATMRYPVGKLGDVTLYFQHYKSFDRARDQWMKRVPRIDPARTLFVMTDRDGASRSDLEAFDALDGPKLLFVSRAQPGVASALHVRSGNERGQVGDLYTNWSHLAAPLSRRRLARLHDELAGR